MIVIRRILFLFLITISIVSCEQHANIKVVNVHLEETEDLVEPPFPKDISNFKNLQDWLNDVCNSNKPKKDIQKFKFGLLESKDAFILYVIGTNTYREGKDRSSTRIEFEPVHNYLKLSDDKHKYLNYDQLVTKLIKELKNFTNTSTFQNSFFTKAKTVVFETNGQVIWSNDELINSN